jgi:hypothetical protein
VIVMVKRSVLRRLLIVLGVMAALAIGSAAWSWFAATGIGHGTFHVDVAGAGDTTRGPTGPTGPTGARGATGATGARGAIGATGAVGAQGARGPTGTHGPTGATGAKGATGARGATGAKGATGAQGIQGVRGPTGLTGARGATGAQGAQGQRGATGPAGANGVSGWSRQSASNAALGKGTVITVTCPSGKVFGGGVDLTSLHNNNAAYAYSWPSADNAWSAVWNGSTTQSNTSVTVYALCATAS